MRRIRSIGAVAVLAALFALPQLPATAQETAPPEIPQGSILALPEEVAALGGSAAEVAAQEEVWAALPADVRDEQAALAHAAHEEFAEAFEHIIDPSVARAPSSVSCSGVYGPTSYKVAVNIVTGAGGVQQQCFAGTAGTYVLPVTMTDNGGTGDARLQAGGFTGRVYYQLSTTHYWSTNRGPNDYTWHHFNISYDHIWTVKRVQLL